MIQSMTAFANAEKSAEDYAVTVEIRAYNSRYLDIALRLPHGYQTLEDRIKTFVSNRLSRGRVEMGVHIQCLTDTDYNIDVDFARVKGYQTAISRLKEILDVKEALSMEFLLGHSGIVRLSEPQKDQEACWSVLKDAIGAAMDDLDVMKTREGEAISKDFNKRLCYIEACLTRIQNAAPGLLSSYQDRLRDRIAALTNGVLEIDPGRIAQEAAFYADRSDISEEIVRARSHLDQFRAIMASDEPAGRKLNFLLQEFTREFNTMGAKAGNADTSHIIVAVKSELEKIREQVQNVE